MMPGLFSIVIGISTVSPGKARAVPAAIVPLPAANAIVCIGTVSSKSMAKHTAVNFLMQ